MNNKTNWQNLVAACAAITVFGLPFGMTYPLLSLILESRGVSTPMIGLNSAMMPIGILLFSQVIPVATRRFGSSHVAVTAALTTAVLTLLYKVFDSLEAWFLLRLLQGMSISTLFVLSESWIVKFADHEHRGKVVAVYGSILSASFGAGPALIGWTGIEGWLPFLVAASVVIAGIAPLLLVNDERTADHEETSASGVFAFAPKAPTLLLAVGVFAVFDAASMSLLPVYGLLNGLDMRTAANALTALIIGNIVLQFPIGWLADKYPRRSVLMGCAAATCLTSAILPFTMGSALMWPVLILIGVTGYGVYTVSLSSLGDRFTGHELVNGSAAFAMVWGIGALLGSISGGWAMRGFGPHGLPGLVAGVYLVLAVGLFLRRSRVNVYE